MNIILIDWPPKELHPNSRTDRRHTTGIRKRYKETCWAVACNHKKDFGKRTGKIKTHIVFYVPDNRRRDLDGMLSAVKYGIDGVCLALGIDDNQLRPMTLDVVHNDMYKGNGVVSICLD